MMALAATLLSPLPPYCSGIRTARKPDLGERRHEVRRIGALAVEAAPVFAREAGAQRAHRLADRRDILGARTHPQTSLAILTIMRSFAHCSRSASVLPSWVDAKPHCGLKASCSMSTNFAACSIRRLIAGWLSSLPAFEVTSPSTTVLPLGTKRSGSKPPAR